MELYHRIKKKREELNISQDELAIKLGYKSRSSINKIEMGKSDIPQSKIKAFADALNTTPSYLMGWDDDFVEKTSYNSTESTKGFKIPVLGKVVAGIPIEAVQDIIDYEEISKEMAKTGDFFALQVSGKSMEPRMQEGDVVIVKKQPDIESGDIAIVLINGCDATIKKVIKQDNGLLLIANNQDVYQPKFYSANDIESLPVTIIGKVVELRGKF